MNILYLSDILNVHDERLTKQFLAAGHGITLLTFYHRTPELPPFVEGVKILQERYKMYPDGNGASRWKLIRDVEYRRDEARACLKIKDTLRKGRYDAVFANWALTSGYVAAHAGAKPLVLFPWGSDILVWPKLHRGFAERASKALRSADLVVCNSKLAAEECKRIGHLRPERVEILPIELDGGKFEPKTRNEELRKSWGFPDDAVIVVSTRPLKEMYDHPILLGALAKPGAEKVCVVFVGEGNLREDLEKRAKDLEVDSRVRFAGMVDNERIPEHLCAADLYITCSRSDSASLGLLEAMAIGMPCIASDIPANKEWIADGQSGWLFPGGNSEALSKVFEKVAVDPKNRDEVAFRGRAIALARADARKNFPKLLQRIESLVAASKPVR